MSSIISADFFQTISPKNTHYHDCHQIFFVVSGSACLWVDEKAYDLQSGDLAVISRFENHAITCPSSDYQRYVLQIDPGLQLSGENCTRAFSILFNRPQGFRNVLPVGDESPYLNQLFATITREVHHNRPMQEDMLELLLQQLLIHICRLLPEAFATLEANSFPAISHIQRRLQADFSKRITLEQLAQDYNISSSYLSHLFKNATGTSVMGYLLSCRITEAKKLLVETDDPINTISEYCGFSDHSNFTRTFRRITHLTPSQFRKTNTPILKTP